MSEIIYTINGNNSPAFNAYLLGDYFGLSYFIYPHADHYLLRIDNTVRLPTPQELEAWRKFEQVYQLLPNDPNCEACHGFGMFYTHSDKCESEFCALAGGYDDCDGVVVECDCKLPITAKEPA